MESGRSSWSKQSCLQRLLFQVSHWTCIYRSAANRKEKCLTAGQPPFIVQVCSMLVQEFIAIWTFACTLSKNWPSMYIHVPTLSSYRKSLTDTLDTGGSPLQVQCYSQEWSALCWLIQHLCCFTGSGVYRILYEEVVKSSTDCVASSSDFVWLSAAGGRERGGGGTHIQPKHAGCGALPVPSSWQQKHHIHPQALGVPILQFWWGKFLSPRVLSSQAEKYLKGTVYWIFTSVKLSVH